MHYASIDPVFLPKTCERCAGTWHVARSTLDVGPPGERRGCYHAPHPAHSSPGVHLSTNLAPAQGSEFAGTAEPRNGSVATPLGCMAGRLDSIGVVVEWPA